MKKLKNVARKILTRKPKKYNGPEKFVPGHYYSLIPDLENVKQRQAELFEIKNEIPGVDLNLASQIDCANEFLNIIKSEKSDFKGERYDPENDSFSYDDGPILQLFLRKFQPKKIIEIGSGYSSGMMLDTSEKFSEIKPDFVFIDIDCNRLRRNLKTEEKNNVTIMEMPVQEVDLDVFRGLNDGDLLFVDSSHVSKIGSDLNHIMFHVLPALKKGVHVHFHDIRYPFEYRPNLIFNKVFWNEAYILRAFMTENNSYEITFWMNCLLNQKLGMNHSLFNELPLKEWSRRFNNNTDDYKDAGGSIYLRKK